ncbi:uncharacterized protein [Erythrolamprus reginae]|uniref:uncharacterized protein isoform X2 n=1 Tax=Erythrolamprus reginae TaxID=121349 RepID=UPI00396CD08C
MIVWRRLLLPLLWAAIVPCVAKDCHNRTTIVGVEGEDIVLSSSVPGHGSPQKIHWMKGGNIVASSIFPLEKKKQSLDSSGNLLIKNLSQEDAGYYTAENIIDEKITKKCFDLKILVQPDINCTVNKTTIQLDCTSASEEYLSLEYSWDYITNEEMTNVKDSVVLLPRSSKHFQKITCIVTAFSSSANNSINWSDCILLEKEPDHQSNTTLYIIIPIIILVLGFVFGFLYYKKRSELREEERNPLNAPEQSNLEGKEKSEERSELREEERNPLNAPEQSNLEGKEKSEERSELREEERNPLNAPEQSNLEGKEKSEERSELREEERNPLNAPEQSNLEGKEKSEERSELREEERNPLNATEQSNLEGKEKSEERSELREEERNPLNATEQSNLEGKEKSEERSELREEERNPLNATEQSNLEGKEKSEESSELREEERNPLNAIELSNLEGKEKSEETSRL